VLRLTDENALAAIALDDSDPEVRESAARMLTDEELRRHVMKNTQDINVRNIMRDQLKER
jgi:hypothetical protein